MTPGGGRLQIGIGGRLRSERVAGFKSESLAGLRRNQQPSDPEPAAWRGRLRSTGQILWGLLRKDFTVPGAWNIRGQERTLTGLIGRDLERLPISSAIVSILESCLLPRSIETSLMFLLPRLFGIAENGKPNDVSFDPMRLASLNDLHDNIRRVQKVLVTEQVTVLRHQPRQLVPVQFERMATFPNALAPDGDEGQQQ